MLKQKKREKNLNNNTNKDINTNTNKDINTNTNSINTNVNISNIEHYTRLVDEQVQNLKKEGKTIEEIAQFLSPTAREEFIKREELIQKNRERKEYLNNKYGTDSKESNNNTNNSIIQPQKKEEQESTINTNSISIKVNISNIEHYTRLVDEQVKKLKQQGMPIDEIAQYLNPTNYSQIFS